MTSLSIPMYSDDVERDVIVINHIPSSARLLRLVGSKIQILLFHAAYRKLLNSNKIRHTFHINAA